MKAVNRNGVTTTHGRNESITITEIDDFVDENFDIAERSSPSRNEAVQFNSPVSASLPNSKLQPILSLSTPPVQKKTKDIQLNGSENLEARLCDIFEVEGKTYDVKLFHSKFVLKVIGSNRKSQTNKQNNRRLSGATDEILLTEIFGATMRHRKSGKSQPVSRPGSCLGIELHLASPKDCIKLRHQTMYLAHPSEELCSRWINQILSSLKKIPSRPQLIRVYINCEAGRKEAWHVWNNEVHPILKAAAVIVQLVDEYDAEKMQADIGKLDLSAIDGLLILGGDGTVNAILNAVLRKTQQDNSVKVGGSEHLVELQIPIGVIPCGFTNHIARTVFGCEDVETATLHVVYGHTLKADICSISNKREFVRFAFNAHYGFGGDLMQRAEKFKVIGGSKFQAGILRGLSKDKLRSYECDIQMTLAAPSVGTPVDGVECRSGCRICYGENMTPKQEGSVYNTDLQDFIPSLNDSNNSSSLRDMNDDGRHKKLKGSFLNISVFSNAELCDMAPLGLSKFTHLADGYMDVVVVRNTDRKNFMRFLKRNGNKKNQLDFPFVESFRVTEASFHTRMPDGWNYRDKDYCEINQEVKRKIESMPASESVEVIDDLVTNLRVSDESEEDVTFESGSEKMSQASRNASATTRSSAEEAHSGVQDAKDEATAKAGHVHIIHKSTATDRIMQKRRQKELEKEMEAKAKEEATLRSIWCMDSTATTDTDVSFRCHTKLVTFFGCGLNMNAEVDDVMCFPAV